MSEIKKNKTLDSLKDKLEKSIKDENVNLLNTSAFESNNVIQKEQEIKKNDLLQETKQDSKNIRINVTLEERHVKMIKEIKPKLNVSALLRDAIEVEYSKFLKNK